MSLDALVSNPRNHPLVRLLRLLHRNVCSVALELTFIPLSMPREAYLFVLHLPKGVVAARPRSPIHQE